MEITLSLIILMVAYLLVQLYLTIRIGHYLNHAFDSKAVVVLLILLYLVLAAVPVLGTFLKNTSWKYLLMMAGNVWIGVVIVLAVVIILLHLITVIIRVDEDLGKAAAFILLFISLVLAIGVNVYGFIHAREVKTTEYNIEVNQHITEPKALKVAFISDLHLDVNSSPATIRKMVTEINKNEVDVVLVGGDTFTGSFAGLKDPEKYIRELSNIQSKEGVYAVYGNHDVEEETFAGIGISPRDKSLRSEEMEQFFNDVGWNMLKDGQVRLSNDVILIGRLPNGNTGVKGLVRRDVSNLLRSIRRTDSVIVVEYEPYDLHTLADNGADVIFSGQTHGGQFIPLNYIYKYLSDNNYGVKEINSATAIATSGIGTMGPPIRLGTDGEVVIANITFS